MNKLIGVLVVAMFHISYLAAQSTNRSDSSFIISLNQQIDHFVVEKNTTALATLYADDFVFSHGSGRVEGKFGWFGSVAKGNFLSRQHDSVTVEMHPDLAIVRGKLSVAKKNVEKADRYHLYYFRVYAFRKNAWQMISHITFSEFHEP